MSFWTSSAEKNNHFESCASLLQCFRTTVKVSKNMQISLPGAWFLPSPTICPSSVSVYFGVSEMDLSACGSAGASDACFGSGSFVSVLTGVVGPSASLCTSTAMVMTLCSLSHFTAWPFCKVNPKFRCEMFQKALPKQPIHRQ